MTTTVQASATRPLAKGAPMSSTRKTALVAGIFYLITFISIPTLALYGPVQEPSVLDPQLRQQHRRALRRLPRSHRRPRRHRHRRHAVPGGQAAERGGRPGVRHRPRPRRRHDLRRRRQPPVDRHLATRPGGASGANAAALVTTAASHVAVYKWTFLLGQTLMPAINALLLGSFLYRSRLVPRILPVIGLIGAPLLISAVIAKLFGGSITTPRGRRSRPSRSLPGSSPSACGWSSRASGPPQSPPQWTPPARRAPTRTSRPDPPAGRYGRALPRARPYPRRQPVAGADGRASLMPGLTGRAARARSRRRR